jgi:hypothetical protein
MKRTTWLVLIILTVVTPPTWAQFGPVKLQESKDAMTYFRCLGVKHFLSRLDPSVSQRRVLWPSLGS